ncbi:MAG: hypothetical protein K2H93_07495 [Oscillospiraceae bacterium]|nr:hypothetical protein [Oscillospiraceae bacterium]
MTILKQRTSQMLVLLLAVFAGVILGSILHAFYPTWAIWENATFLQGMGLTILHGKLFYYILTPFFWLAVLGMLGLSAVGLVGTPIVLILRGTALGAILEILYASNGFKGILIALLFIMPYAFSATVIMALGARETFRFSMQIAGLVCEKTQENLISVQLYIIRFLVLFALLALSGILQCLLMQYGYPVFMKFY